MDLIKRFLSAIVGSKKAVAAIVAAIFVLLVPVLKRLGIEVTPEEKKTLVELAIAYLVAQGVADINKEAAKVTAAAVTSAVAVTPPAGDAAPVTVATADTVKVDG